MPTSSSSSRARTSNARAATSRSNNSTDAPSRSRPRNRSKALESSERHGPRFALPGVGQVTLPPVEHLVWYGAIGVMAVLELIDWPVALLIAAGKALADNRHSATLQNLGEALEDVD